MNLIELYAFLKQVWKNDKGVTAMEYGVIAAFTVVAISASMMLIGPKLTSTFSKINSALPS